MITHHQGVPVLGFVAASGTGKTTLLRALIPLLHAQGLRVGCIKHTHHHPFEIDHEGKDSYALREAGARQILIGSARRWALIVETEREEDVGLTQMLDRLQLDALDLILVEGFKLEAIPKIEIHRVELGAALLCTSTTSIIALASNQRPPPALAIPVLDLDQPADVVSFMLTHIAALAGLRSAGANE